MGVDSKETIEHLQRCIACTNNKSQKQNKNIRTLYIYRAAYTYI